MSYTCTYIVNGYSITFSDFGLLLNPHEIDLDDKEYIEALKVAQEVYDTINNVHYIVDYAYLGNLQHCSDDWLQDMLDRCEKAEIQTVIALWPQAIEAIKNVRQERDFRIYGRPKSNQTKKDKAKPGYVYLLQAESGAYKIGRTQDPANRIKTFGIQLPFEVDFICVIQTPDMAELESRLHTKFADKQIRGEWFELNEDDVEYIKSLDGGI